VSETVHLVHCIDTEGPLHESVEATFERLMHIFHLDLPPSKELLSRLQRGEEDLGGLEQAVRNVVDPHLLAYNDTWDKVDSMLSDALSSSFRQRYPDSFGAGWIYNWHCVDHVDYDVNPRRRDMGYHNVFDHYRAVLAEHKSEQDGLHFHYHPHAFKRHAHLCATQWWGGSDSLSQVLCRRIIDRHWFPSCNRPGFQVTRPDSHWFLEQHIPFDYASMAIESTAEDEQQFDFSQGRSGDWRRAPLSWEPYHPSHDDYQVVGECRRWIARCLNIGTRAYVLTRAEVERAFREAQNGQPVVLGITNHDFRDIRHDIAQVHALIKDVASDFPDVPWRNCEAVDAFRRAMGLSAQPAGRLSLVLEPVGANAHQLRVRFDQPSFGPQPYLALKTTADCYLHDNFDFQEPLHEWTYVFDGETLPLQAIERIGVAVNNANGATSVVTLDPLTGNQEQVSWNE
jgi:hypothetical protein